VDVQRPIEGGIGFKTYNLDNDIINKTKGAFELRGTSLTTEGARISGYSNFGFVNHSFWINSALAVPVGPENSPRTLSVQEWRRVS